MLAHRADAIDTSGVYGLHRTDRRAMPNRKRLFAIIVACAATLTRVLLIGSPRD
jgi:hypothetical protein